MYMINKHERNVYVTFLEFSFHDTILIKT